MTATPLKPSRPVDGLRVMVVLLLLACPGVAFPELNSTTGSPSDANVTEAPAKADLCTKCHGANGLPTRAEIPIIWGQEFYYLYVQLKDYKAGRRQNTEMNDIVKSLSKQDMRELAQYFAGKAWPSTRFVADAADVARGETATAAGVCVQCHLGGYEGNSRVPRLAGQQVGYLQRTMLDFKGKTRMNSPSKASLLKSFADEDITAMARYLGAQ